MIITHKKVKELEEIKEALMIRIEDLITKKFCWHRNRSSIF